MQHSWCFSGWSPGPLLPELCWNGIGDFQVRMVRNRIQREEGMFYFNSFCHTCILFPSPNFSLIPQTPAHPTLSSPPASYNNRKETNVTKSKTKTKKLKGKKKTEQNRWNKRPTKQCLFCAGQPPPPPPMGLGGTPQWTRGSQWGKDSEGLG